jgi:hypothetical protein
MATERAQPLRNKSDHGRELQSGSRKLIRPIFVWALLERIRVDHQQSAKTPRAAVA